MEQQLDKRLTKVIALPIMKKFDSLKDACEFINLSNSTGITVSCQNDFVVSGADPKTGEKLRWMYLNDYEKNGDKCENVPIICLNTLEIFPNMKTAGNKYNVEDYKIGRACLGKRKYCGIHPYTKERLIWMYLDEYKEMSLNDKTVKMNKVKEQSIIQKKGLDSYKYKVICLNTGEKFKRMSDAGKKYGVDDRRIYDACNGVVYGAGKDPKTGETLTWLYYKDYKNGESFPKKNIGKKSIICLNTGKVFRKMNMAADAYNIKYDTLRRALYGIRKSAGLDKNGAPLVWMFYDEYSSANGKELAKKRIAEANSPKEIFKILLKKNRMTATY